MTTNSFPELLNVLWQRTKMPLTDATFVMYFICAILICGGVGFWTEVLKIIISSETTSFGGIQASLSVFYPALIGTSCLLLILESVEKRDISVQYFLSFLEGARDIDFSEKRFHNPSGSGRTIIRQEIEIAIGINDA